MPLPPTLSPAAIFDALESAGDCALEGFGDLRGIGAALLDVSEHLPTLMADTLHDFIADTEGTMGSAWSPIPIHQSPPKFRVPETPQPPVRITHDAE